MLCIHSSGNGYLVCFHVLALVTNGSTDVSLRPCFSSFGYTIGSEIAGSCGNAIFNFLRNHHTIFHSSHSILHSQPQGTRVPISPRLCQHLFSVFYVLIVAILMGLRWYLIEVLILFPDDIEHLFMCLLLICIPSLQKFKSYVHF